MLAKLTSKNQLTLPKTAVQAAGNPGYFEIEIRNGQLVLTPVRMQRADAVRAKLAELDLDDKDLGAAVEWARKATLVAEERADYRKTSKSKRQADKPSSP